MKYTDEQLEALPAGTILIEHSVLSGTSSPDNLVWLISEPGQVKLLSHEGFDDDGAIGITALGDAELTVAGYDPKTGALPYDSGTPGKIKIFYNTYLNMSKGKLAAHAVHAALQAFGVHPGMAVVVLGAKPKVIREMDTFIIDEGRTEIPPGSLTAGTNYPRDAHE